MLSLLHIHFERYAPYTCLLPDSLSSMMFLGSCDAALRARIYVIIQTIYMSSAVTNFVDIAEARDSPSWFGLKQHLPLFDSPHQTMTCTRFSSVQHETTNNCNNGAFKNER